MELRPEEITKIIKSQIKNYENHIVQEEVGTVLVVGDGIARASGLEKCMMNELLEFPNGEYGIAQNLEENTVAVIILGDDGGIKEGDTVGRLVVELDGKEVASTDLLAGADVTRRSFFLTVWNFLRSLVKG